MMFEKGEKEFARRRIRTRVDRVEKSKTHTVSSSTGADDLQSSFVVLTRL